MTGGLAVSDVQVSNSFSDNATGAGGGGIGGTSTTETKLGYTVGGGLELALDGAWSIKGEYLYVDLGSASTAGTIGCRIQPCTVGFSPFNTMVDLTANIARVGINYRFAN